MLKNMRVGLRYNQIWRKYGQIKTFVYHGVCDKCSLDGGWSMELGKKVTGSFLKTFLLSSEELLEK